MPYVWDYEQIVLRDLDKVNNNNMKYEYFINFIFYQ